MLQKKKFIKSRLALIVIIYLSIGLSFCTTLFKKQPVPIIQENPDGASCNREEMWEPILSFINYEVRGSSWETIQGLYSLDKSVESVERSIALQKSRNLLGLCITILFDAIPTGSNRDLKKIDPNNALKDLDMTVSLEKLSLAERWLQSKISDPERMLSMSLLVDPLENLPCGSLKEDKLEECSLNVSKESLQIILLTRKEMIKKTKQICDGSWDIPEKNSFLQSLAMNKKPAEFENFLYENNIKNPEKRKRYYFYFLATNNPAYYVQPGSLRKWVIEREPELKNRFAKEFPSYSKTNPEPEIEGALIEQWIHSIENEDNFYYKYKYIFRALEHINYDIEKNLFELSNIHRLIRKNRPETQKEVYYILLNLKNKKEYSNDKFFIKYPDLFEYREFLWILERAENEITKTLKNFINEKKQLKNSVINSTCR